MTQATQVPVDAPCEVGRQCGALGLEAQSESVPASFCGLHVVAVGCTQALLALQTRPEEQSLFPVHCTQAPFEQRGVPGIELQSLSLEHPDALTQT